MEDKKTEIFIERMNDLMRKMNISKKEMANQLGMEYLTFWRKLNGKRSVDVTLLGKVAEILGTSVAYLMGETDNPVLGVSEEPEQLQLQKAEKPQDISYINSEKTEDDLGLSYWGSVVDNARRVAKFGNYENMFDVSEMLKRAQASLSIAMGHVSPA